MKNIAKILKLSKPLHKWMWVVCVLITIQAVIQQANPIVLKYVIDELSSQIGNGTGNYEKIITLFVLMFAISVANTAITSIGARIGDHIASRLGKYLTEVFYRKIFTLPQSYFDSEISGKIVNQLSRGIESIRQFVGTATNFITPALLQAIFGIIVLSYYSLTIGLLALSIFPVYIAISNYSTKRWGKIQKEKNVHEDESRGRIQEVISNIKLVKTYNTQRMEWKFISGKYKAINTLYDKQSGGYHILNFVREFGLTIALVVIFFIAIRNTYLGILSLGEMVMIIQLVNQLRRPLFGMSFILERVQSAEADSKAFFEVIDLEGKEVYRKKKIKTLISKPEINIEDVSFSYDEGRVVLSDINLKLDKKETVALVGHSGSGKTTLINLILKLYEPTSGNLYLSGKNYASADHSWIRSHIALVFQESELFSSTVRENVAYGKPKATDKQIIAALKKANAYKFVMSFKNGLDAKIGERGVKLSGGQKQRIQIARAILHNKPVLILDEATSSLDSKSEKLVQDALDNLIKNRLVIIIAHRFSTIQNVDRIVVLDKGSVSDVGKPHDLAQKDGVYSELLKYQIEGNKKLLNKYELS
jgi:ATP-binding cassette subfamily B protein